MNLLSEKFLVLIRKFQLFLGLRHQKNLVAFFLLDLLFESFNFLVLFHHMLQHFASFLLYFADRRCQSFYQNVLVVVEGAAIR